MDRLWSPEYDVEEALRVARRALRLRDMMLAGDDWHGDWNELHMVLLEQVVAWRRGARILETRPIPPGIFVTSETKLYDELLKATTQTKNQMRLPTSSNLCVHCSWVVDHNMSFGSQGPAGCECDAETMMTSLPMADQLASKQVLITGGLAAGLVILFFFVFSSYSRQPKVFKGLTVRIDEIPTKASQDDVHDCLWSIVQADSTLRKAIKSIRVYSLVARDHSHLCATVVFTSILSGGDLPRSLYRAAAARGCQYRFTCNFEGVTPIYSPGPDAHVDVVAVTGLAGHALGSWKSKNGNQVWLRDFLPDDIPNARILLYGYDTKLQGSIQKQSISVLGDSFLEQITSFRVHDHTNTRPILFVGHSLGGLVIKQALVRAFRKKRKSNVYLSFYKASYGMLFFGVPNLGLRHPALMTLVKGQPNGELVRELLPDEDTEARPFLKDLKEQFGECYTNHCQAVAFFERGLSPTVQLDDNARPSRTGPMCLQVTEESACATGLESFSIRIPSNADHSGLVKFSEKGVGDYSIVCKWLQELALNAPAEVSKRFDYPSRQPLTKAQEDCLKSLAFPGMNSRFDTISTAAEGTCRWLFDHETWKIWRQQSRGLLCVQGNPGSGKSTLLHFAHGAYSAMYGRATPIVSFFCHGRGDELQKSPLGMYRSILHQLLGYFPAAFSRLTDKFIENEKTIGACGDKWQWHENQLQHVLLSSLPNALNESSITFFFDALDEFGNRDAVHIVDTFNRLVQIEQPGNKCNQLSICFSCRYYPNIDLRTSSVVHPEKENHGDVSKFVASQTSSTFPKDLQTMIIQSSGGIFMWARLAVERALQMDREGDSPKKIKIYIQQLPPELHDVYHRLIYDELKSDPVKRKQSLALFQWLCFSQEPLFEEEIPWAIASMTDDTITSIGETEQGAEFIPIEKVNARVRYLSCGLIEIIPLDPDQRHQRGLYGNGECRLLQFVHQSAKDYFLQNGLDSLLSLDNQTFQANLIPGRSGSHKVHLRLSLACMSYLRVRAQSDQTYSQLSFFPYASNHWIDHLRLADPRPMHTQSVLRALGIPTQQTFDGLVGLSSVKIISIGDTLTHVFSVHGISVLQYLLTNVDEINAQVNQRNVFGETPLMQSVEAQSVAGVRMLLAANNIDVNLGNWAGNTPLTLAVKRGATEVIDILIHTKEVDLDACDSSGQTPLSLAAQRNNAGVVEQLIETGKVDPDSRDEKGRTPFSWAVAERATDVIELLFKTGEVDIDTRDLEGRTPLSLAAENNEAGVVELLIKTGKVDPDSRDERERTPLSWAIGDEKTVALLIDTQKVEIDSGDVSGYTPLWYAISELDYDNRGPHPESKRSQRKRIFGGIKALLDTGQADQDLGGFTSEIEDEYLSYISGEWEQQTYSWDEWL